MKTATESHIVWRLMTTSLPFAWVRFAVGKWVPMPGTTVGARLDEMKNIPAPSTTPGIRNPREGFSQARRRAIHTRPRRAPGDGGEHFGAEPSTALSRGSGFELSRYRAPPTSFLCFKVLPVLRLQLSAALIDLCIEEEHTEFTGLQSVATEEEISMATPNKRMAVVWAGLAVCNVMVAVAAQADVSFEQARNFAAGSSP